MSHYVLVLVVVLAEAAPAGVFMLRFGKFNTSVNHGSQKVKTKTNRLSSDVFALPRCKIL